MNTRMLTRARELFSVDYMPQEINRANQRKWVRSIRVLGDKWLLSKSLDIEMLAKQMERKTHG